MNYQKRKYFFSNDTSQTNKDTCPVNISSLAFKCSEHATGVNLQLAIKKHQNLYFRKASITTIFYRKR